MRPDHAHDEASIDYGPYSVNEAVADTVFGGS
jgi:hypothetical protein